MVGHTAVIATVLYATTSTWWTALRDYIAEQVLSHHKGSKPIGKSIDPVTRIRTGVNIWPDNVKARVDVWYRKAMKCRMS